MRDARGYSVSGASAAALDAYEQAVAASQSWRSGADALLGAALREAPGFVMAHVLQACLYLCSRDPRRVVRARPVLASASALAANERERMHLDALRAALADDIEGAKARLGELLRHYPRDAVALQVVHSFDYLSGDVDRLGDRVAAVLPAWSDQLPGFHAVLAMHAFSLEECGRYEQAEEEAARAIELNRRDARAHHVMAHVFEMTDRPDDGARWLDGSAAVWSRDSVVITHCWWHLALFHLGRGEPGRALQIYDEHIGKAGRSEVADLIDASALLWRIGLAGSDTGARWRALAAAWEPHIDDGFCSFNDLHAMLAFVGARDWERAGRLESVLAGRRLLPTRHGETTRQLGLPACRALLAFGQGNYPLALTLLASLPAVAHRFGGSHAQRDVLNLTMLKAVEHLRRPARRARMPAPGLPLTPLGGHHEQFEPWRYRQLQSHAEGNIN